jgi:hypothetical protein
MIDANSTHTSQPQPTAITAITADALLAAKIPERRLLIAPWLPERGLAMIYAPRGLGKTFLALSAAYAIASGGSVLGWKAATPTPVLYVDGEMPLQALQQRLRGIIAGSDARLIDEEDFRLLSADTNFQGIPDIGTEEGRRVILDNLGKAKVVVFDNLSTLTGARENEADEWLPIQRFLLELRRRGIAVILVHHAGRNGHARGTSRREDILDTVVSLKRPDDYEPNQGARFVVDFEKARGFSGEDAAPIEATLVIDPTSGAISWEFGPPRDAFGRAMEMFSEGRSVKDVIAELGVAKPTAYRWHQKFRSGG